MKTIARITKMSVIALVAAVIGLVYVGSVAGQTINWSGEVAEPPQVFIDRKGDPLNTDFTIALGSFGSYVPVIQDYQNWISNFKVFDTAVFNVDAGYFASEASLNPDRTSGSGSSLVNLTDQFLPGEQAYIWIYDTLDTEGEFDWALVTAVSWLFPESGEECCDDGIVFWRLSDSGVTTAIGGVNQVRGPGYYVDITSLTFTIQTATIPEPSVMFLAGFIGFLSLLRRRRC